MTSKRFPGWVSGVAVDILFFGLLSGLALWLYWRIMEFLALRRTPEDRALSDGTSGLVEFFVEVMLYDTCGCYGVDRGFVWFEEGLLTFNGAACSFVVAVSDVDHRREWNGQKLHAGVPARAIHFWMPGETFYATLRPLSGLRGLTFEYHLGRFMASADVSDRPRQWPPLTASIGRAVDHLVPVCPKNSVVEADSSASTRSTAVVSHRP